MLVVQLRNPCLYFVLLSNCASHVKFVCGRKLFLYTVLFLGELVQIVCDTHACMVYGLFTSSESRFLLSEHILL